MAPGAQARPAALAGILWILLAIFCFGVMDSMIKWLSGGYATWQIIFFRALFALIPIAVVLMRGAGLRGLRTDRIASHILRACVGIVAIYCFFRSFAAMPLADVYAISFAAPLIITALSVPLLREPVGWRRWAAVLVGFVGVLIMLRPGTGVVGGPALLCLLGTVFYALTMIFVRVLSRTETNAAIVFYYMATLTIVSGLAMLPDWRTPGALDMAVLAGTGIIGGVAQLALTQAFRLAPPSLLAPFEYTGMIWAVVFGFAFFGEVPDAAIGVGVAIVIASGLYIIHREAVVARATAQAAPGSPERG